MIATLLIAIAAGSASALMFASLVSGALISLLLFYLAPLPLMVAALGWGPLSAAAGGIAAAAGLGAIFGLPYCIAFAAMVALPAWWLGHLALLGRPIDNNTPGNGAAPVVPDVEWYPVGRILLWIAGFAMLTTMAALLTLGSDAETITGTLRQFFQQVIGLRDAGAATGDTGPLIDALVMIAPAAAAIFATTTLTLNLFLSAKIIETSGRLHRPWPDLRSAALPPMTLPALCVAFAFCFTGGLLSILAHIVAAALMMAYGLIGFAVLHALTLTLKSRALWLGCTYVIMAVFVWPVVVMVALGLADAIFGLRRRFLRGRPPPLPVS